MPASVPSAETITPPSVEVAIGSKPKIFSGQWTSQMVQG